MDNNENCKELQMNFTYRRTKKTRNYKIANGIADITIFSTDTVYFIYMRVRSVFKTYQLLTRCMSENINQYQLLVECGY